MKPSELDTSLKITDLENFFSVHEDKRGNYVYNLNETLYLNADNACELYTLNHDAFWTTLSYILYDTTHLAWMLMKLNKVDGDHIFDIVKAGSKIKYLPVDIAIQVVEGL